MKYMEIPPIPRPVSRIVLGGTGRHFSSGGDVSALMEAALENGINAVDTARQYGESESALGKWLRSSGKRDRIVLITKSCHPKGPLDRVNEKAAEEDLARSLEALGTDRIDLYLLHRDDERVPVGRILEFLNRFREEGRILAFGGSNWSAARVAEANAYAESYGLQGFSVSSPHYSLGRQVHEPWGDCRTLTGEENAAERDYYLRSGMPVLAWSSLCGGVFSGKLKSGDWRRMGSVLGLTSRHAYFCPDNKERLIRCERLAQEKGVPVSRIALSWLLNDPIRTLAIISASSPERIGENAAAAEFALSEGERAYLDLQRETP